MERFKNYVLWVAVAGLIGFILQLAGVPLAPEDYDKLLNYVFTIAIALGLINNPSIGAGLRDKKKGDDK
jgi:uncharacterized membrane protein